LKNAEQGTSPNVVQFGIFELDLQRVELREQCRHLFTRHIGRARPDS